MREQREAADWDIPYPSSVAFTDQDSRSEEQNGVSISLVRFPYIAVIL